MTITGNIRDIGDSHIRNANMSPMIENRTYFHKSLSCLYL